MGIALVDQAGEGPRGAEPDPIGVIQTILKRCVVYTGISVGDLVKKRTLDKLEKNVFKPDFSVLVFGPVMSTKFSEVVMIAIPSGSDMPGIAYYGDDVKKEDVESFLKSLGARTATKEGDEPGKV